mmetsp:Transcript_23076/g.46398  ORF Transcript_23076/g.46398 Transcript_23076/m.46398 type:complete len:267 (-) Transcript_23076:612-1412(-)
MEIRLDGLGVQVVLQLLYRERARMVGVELLEDLEEAVDVHLFLLQNRLHHEVLVVLSTVDGVLTEDARQDVEHRELSKPYVADEERDVPLAHVAQRVNHLHPAHASRDRHEQRSHAPRHGRPVDGQGLLAVSDVIGIDELLRLAVHGDALREQNAKGEDHDREQQEAPDQGLDGVDELVREGPQGAEEADEARHADDADEPRDADDAQDAELRRGAHARRVTALDRLWQELDDQLGQRCQDDEDVQHVPSELLRPKEGHALGIQPE